MCTNFAIFDKFGDFGDELNSPHPILDRISFSPQRRLKAKPQWNFGLKRDPPKCVGKCNSLYIEVTWVKFVHIQRVLHTNCRKPSVQEPPYYGTKCPKQIESKIPKKAKNRVSSVYRGNVGKICAHSRFQKCPKSGRRLMSSFRPSKTCQNPKKAKTEVRSRKLDIPRSPI